LGISNKEGKMAKTKGVIDWDALEGKKPRKPKKVKKACKKGKSKKASKLTDSGFAKILS
jgi:hypothetical protein